MTLIEIMVSCALMGMLVYITVEANVLASRSFQRISDASSSASTGRVGFDRLLEDIRNADAHLFQYPTVGTIYAKSDRTSTIILRSKRFDVNGDVINGQYDVKIYRLEAVTGGDGPYVLKRYLASVLNPSQPPKPTLDKVVATRVKSLDIRTAATEVFYGDQSTKSFTLIGLPYGSDSLITESVLVGGVNRLLDGYASLSSKKITFIKAPNSAVPIDVTYQVKPDESFQADGSTIANFVVLKMVVQAQWKTATSVVQNRDITLSSRVMLLNR